MDSAFNLPDDGEGYMHWYGNDPYYFDDWGCLEMISMIEAAGRYWYWVKPQGRADFCALDISKGDFSTGEFGGYWSDHYCHRNGCDLDVRYQRKDGKNLPLDMDTAIDQLDKPNSLTLLRAFSDAQPLHCIIVDYRWIDLECTREPCPEYIILDGGPNTDHSDHIHIGIAQPPCPDKRGRDR